MIFTPFYVKIKEKHTWRVSMVKKFIFVLLSITLIFGAFLSPGKGLAAARNTLTISEDIVNVRGGPSLSYQLVKQVKKGEKYSILKEKGDWIQIDLSNGKTGWVANWLITKEKNNESTNPTSLENTIAEADTDQLRVRSGPGTSFRIIGLLNKGQAVTVLENNENWIKISTPFGEGWVASQYVKMKSEKQESNSNPNGTNKMSKGVVTGDTLNVRKEPSTTSTTIGKLSKGMSITIYSKQNNWLEIQFSNQKAWVSAKFVTIQAGSAEEQMTKAKGVIGTVTANSLSVRSSSSLNSKIVGTIAKGEQFTILEEVNSWVKIEFKPGSFGWAAGWYLEKNTANSSSGQAVKEGTVTILHNGTNIRKEPLVQSDVLERANEGDIFEVNEVKNDWYKIKLKDGSTGYVAGWIVSISGSAPSIEKRGAQNYLKSKTIVLDPGHGGGDNGATGVGGTLEKELTLRTAQLLYDKLRAAGANVFLTRNSDSFISLPSRVSFASSIQADAFISLHYDSNLDGSVHGMTSYYYHSYQKSLAETLNTSVINETRLKNRGVRFGDFHVIRENSQQAALMELGYLSNPGEEITLNSGQFQENAATGLYNGLAHFFKGN